MTGPIVSVRGLTVEYEHRGAWSAAVRDVDLVVNRGETYGVVGESGSGKTTLVLAILRYLSQGGRVAAGSVHLGEIDVLGLDQSDLHEIWGSRMSMVPQDPLSSLNPSMRIGEQLAESLRLHRGLGRAAARDGAEELLSKVQIPDPRRVAESYPHQISGGMQQRVLIALALGTDPELLILDEPTTALDVTTQAEVLDLISELMADGDSAAIYVSHNLGVVAQVCDRVAVLYAGELVEDASVEHLFHRPFHPYTQGLLDSLPRLGENKSTVELRPIAGRIPELGQRQGGCIFSDRCPIAIDICAIRPDLVDAGDGRRVRCHRWEEISSGAVSPRQESIGRAVVDEKRDGSTILETEEVDVYFPIRRSLSDILMRRPKETVKAVENVSIRVAAGNTMGVVGESGSGKTTLARAISGLVEPTDGTVRLLSVPLQPNLSDRPLETLRRIQMVFQNPDEALNPYLAVGVSLSRPLINLRGLTKELADQEVERLLRAVHLPESYARRLPHELSGGEKQRVAIARAFAASPDLLIGDEPVSSLDVSVQASILNTLNELQVEHQSSMLFISHDLSVVGYLADWVAVVYLGQVMEIAAAEELFEPPYHPYTEALLSAIPLADPTASRERIRLRGEIPSPSDKPTGCPFHTRCHRYLGDICRDEVPPWQKDEEGRWLFCHIPVAELKKHQARVFRPDERGE